MGPAASFPSCWVTAGLCHRRCVMRARFGLVLTVAPVWTFFRVPILYLLKNQPYLCSGEFGRSVRLPAHFEDYILELLFGLCSVRGFLGNVVSDVFQCNVFLFWVFCVFCMYFVYVGFFVVLICSHSLV